MFSVLIHTHRFTFFEAIYQKTSCCSKESNILLLLINSLVVFFYCAMTGAPASIWLSELVIFIRKCIEKIMLKSVEFQRKYI